MALAGERVHLVNATGAVLAWIRVTLVYLFVAVSSFPTVGATARVLAYPICTRAAVVTRSRVTLIDVGRACVASVARRAAAAE